MSLLTAIKKPTNTAPVITSSATGTVAENAAISTIVYTAIATDVDAGTVLTYSLTGTDAALFEIVGSTGVVTLKASANYEANTSYSINVVATDNGTVNLSATQAVTLAINNLDEIAPNITSSSTATAINENSGASKVVYTVTSTDTGDIATGATSYSLKAGTGDDTAFSINSTTGAVTLTANPNFEAKPSYSFTVVATDAAGNASEKAVNLAINNLDEIAPSITSSATATAINENSGASQVVYTAVAMDPSTDVGSTVSYSLKPLTGDSSAFSIDSTTGEVKLTASPNFETKENYSFTVVATDAAGNASEKAVTLAINNLDDTAPVFSSGATTIAINENTSAGQVIYTAVAVDPSSDGGPTTVSYSLKATGDSTSFSINSTTGAVTLTASPNFETKENYSFTVVATDVAGNASDKAVTLAINNLDEIAPNITSSSTATAINENSGASKVVYTVASTDTGDIATGATSYSLKAGTGDDTAFSINSTTGAVTLTASPNFEAKPSYSFTVVATDLAGNAKEQAVALTINDVNEAPAITAPALASIASSISTKTFSGTDLISIADPDAGDVITVNITAFNGTFDITNGSGVSAVFGSDTAGSDANDSLSITGTIAQVNTALAGMVLSAKGALDALLFIDVADTAGLADYKLIEVQVSSSDAPQTVDLTTADLSLTNYDPSTAVFISGTSAALVDVVVAAGNTAIGLGAHSVTLGAFAGALDGTFVQFNDGSLLKTATGASTLIGGALADQLIGSIGNDILRGYAGNDALLGGVGNDVIYGGQGADVITGGAGNDLIYAGSSSISDGSVDKFKYTIAANIEGNDFIVGFLAGSGGDQINVTDLNDSLMNQSWITSHVNQSGANAVVTLGAGESIVLMGVASSSLTVDNFLGA